MVEKIRRKVRLECDCGSMLTVPEGDYRAECEDCEIVFAVSITRRESERSEA